MKVSDEVRQEFVDCIERNRKILEWKSRKRQNVFNDAEDLMAEGVATAFVGLKSYNPAKGSMDAFLHVWFDGGMSNFLRTHGHPIKLPRKTGDDHPYPYMYSMSEASEGDDEGELYSSVPDTADVEREATLEVDLQEAMSALPPYQRELIQKLYLDDEHTTRAQLARDRGVTPMAEGTMEKRALKTLREAMEGWE